MYHHLLAAQILRVVSLSQDRRLEEVLHLLWMWELKDAPDVLCKSVTLLFINAPQILMILTRTLLYIAKFPQILNVLWVLKLVDT